ncbi:Tex-like N-terminal domain-containing protein, partial [Arthrospira platensis SPKY1]|nr:Tex-like N-terminal domain-containing protein [Arthrospira platensis SPKY1]
MLPCAVVAAENHITMKSIIRRLADELAVREEQVKAAVALLDEGATVPFIARYRKEATGAL